MFHPKGPTLRELIRQGMSSTKKGYDLLAPKFDYTPFLTPKEVIDFTAEVLSSEEKDAGDFKYAVDLCTGTGAAIEGLLPLVKKEIVGIDWSEPMLAEARKKFTAVTSPEVRFVCKDIFDIQFLRGYDLVTCFGALGHIEPHRQKEFVDVVHSLLRPGGIFLFQVHNSVKWYWPPDWKYYFFDTAMRIRNYFIKPEFVMYYINFLLSRFLKNRGSSTLSGPKALELFTDGRWSEIKIISPEVDGKKTSLRLMIAKKA